MSVRRVVVSQGADGHDVVVSDGPAPRSHDFAAIPGFSQTLVWTTPPTVRHTDPGDDLTAAVPSLVPEPNGASLIVLTFPPDSVFMDGGFDGAAAAVEGLEHSPGIADRMEPDNPGMHATPTVDYDLVLDGEIWLELSDGNEVRLERGDVAVLYGASHAWRNKSDRPATIAAMLFGARG
jgi:hypothetical protein